MSRALGWHLMIRVGAVQLLMTLLLTGAVQASPFERLLAPKAEYWGFWDAADASDTRTIDHGEWERFLQRYLVAGSDGVNRVRYAAVGEQERQRLGGYVETLARLPIRGYNRDEQLAYWINLYNALTVELILRHHPVDSIRDIDISPGLFADGPWGKKLLSVEGQELSLNDIEHRILRPLWQDPRLHYAVNCASIGCPNLDPIPYTASALEVQLEQAARAYVNHPRGVDFEADGLYLSSIYNWFRADFGDSEQGVVGHLARYADGALKQRLETGTPVTGYRYDWSLNSAP